MLWLPFSFRSPLLPKKLNLIHFHLIRKVHTKIYSRFLPTQILLLCAGVLPTNWYVDLVNSARTFAWLLCVWMQELLFCCFVFCGVLFFFYYYFFPRFCFRAENAQVWQDCLFLALCGCKPNQNQHKIMSSCMQHSVFTHKWGMLHLCICVPRSPGCYLPQL